MEVDYRAMRGAGYPEAVTPLTYLESQKPFVCARFDDPAALFVHDHLFQKITDVRYHFALRA